MSYYLDSNGLAYFWSLLKTKIPFLDSNGRVKTQNLPSIPQKTSDITNDSGFLDSAALSEAVAIHNNSDLSHASLFGAKLNAPIGGTEGQVLTKTSTGQAWQNPPGAAGGEENIINTVKVNGLPLTPDLNKTVNITVPKNVSDLVNDSSFISAPDYIVETGTDANGWIYKKYFSGKYTATKQGQIGYDSVSFEALGTSGLYFSLTPASAIQKPSDTLSNTRYFAQLRKDSSASLNSKKSWIGALTEQENGIQLSYFSAAAGHGLPYNLYVEGKYTT